jgi:hypothetical protein
VNDDSPIIMQMTYHPNPRSHQIYYFVKDLYQLHRDIFLGMEIIALSNTPLALPPEAIDIVRSSPNISMFFGSCLAYGVVVAASLVIPSLASSLAYLATV